MKLTLLSSNTNKLKEYRRFGLNVDIEKGRDLPEVKADARTVAVYKSKTAGIGTIIEDAILTVNGEEIIDIRWKLNSLKDGDKAVWTVTLAVNDGENIKLYQGVTHGTIVKGDMSGSSFGFDPVFKPQGSDLTLKQLDEQGKKDDYSARKAAVQKLLDKKAYYTVRLGSVKDWKGSYQHIDEVISRYI